MFDVVFTILWRIIKMDMLEIILAKRFSQELSAEQISYFVKGVTDKSIPDYQISALLMAIVLNGMTKQEMTELTMQMAFPVRSVTFHKSRESRLISIAPAV